MTATIACLAVVAGFFLGGMYASNTHDDEDEVDPGPLNDDALRRVLSSGHFRASKTLDRVQDAFDRLRRERDAARGKDGTNGRP